jgi:hypothetical protein
LLQGSGGAGPDYIYNNLIYNNAAMGIWAIGNSVNIFNNYVIRNNIFYQNGGTIDSSVRVTQSNNLITDPKFVNASAGDFRVQAGSPAIDKGMAVSQVTTDFDKKPRPQGTRFTVGAYEYTGSAPRPLSTPTRPRRIQR